MKFRCEREVLVEALGTATRAVAIPTTRALRSSSTPVIFGIMWSATTASTLSFRRTSRASPPPEAVRTP